jgi:DNA-directed RNA polymerase subunit RPC12/RpoP
VIGNMDSVKFTCFRCSKSVRALVKHAGRKGKCPSCKAKNTIPGHEQDELLTSVTRFLDSCEASDFEE